MNTENENKETLKNSIEVDNDEEEDWESGWNLFFFVCTILYIQYFCQGAAMVCFACL